MWYVAPLAADKDLWYNPILIPLRFLLLASMMIPVSLKVLRLRTFVAFFIDICYALVARVLNMLTVLPRMYM
jgi:hypothetical protein